MRSRIWVSGVVVWMGCQGTTTTPFAPGLEPVAENQAPAPGADGEYPQEVSIVTGKDKKDGETFVWVNMRGYVHAPAADVWAIMQDPEVVADRRNVDSMQVTLDIEPEYELSYEIHYVVNRILTVEWDENWRYGTVEGTFDAPELGAIRAQKVFGTDFIDFIEISMSVRAIDDGITEIGMVEHMSALEESEGVSARYAEDVFDNVVAVVGGDPLPQY